MCSNTRVKYEQCLSSLRATRLTDLTWAPREVLSLKRRIQLQDESKDAYSMFVKRVGLESLLVVYTSDHLKKKKRGKIKSITGGNSSCTEKDRKRSAIGLQLFHSEEYHSFFTSLHLPE